MPVENQNLETQGDEIKEEAEDKESSEKQNEKMEYIIEETQTEDVE